MTGETDDERFDTACDDLSLGQAIALLAAITAFIFVLALVLGAVP